MPRSSRDEEFSAFVQTRRTGLVRSAYLLTAGTLTPPRTWAYGIAAAGRASR
jgi:hypothetical protein